MHPRLQEGPWGDGRCCLYEDKEAGQVPADAPELALARLWGWVVRCVLCLPSRHRRRPLRARARSRSPAPLTQRTTGADTGS